MMLMHSVLIGVFLYIIMFMLGQKRNVAENRSVLIASLAFAYMNLFGHGLPTSINKNLK